MTNLLLHHIQDQLSHILNRNLSNFSVKQVFGGDINTTYIISNNTDSFFVKMNRSDATDRFAKEFDGLLELRKNTRLQVPEPFIFGSFGADSYLVMECLQPAKPTTKFWQNLGEGLAHLHKQTQADFGLGYNNYIGSLLQTNKPTSSWPEFYAHQRILPLFKMALEAGHCTTKDVAEAEQICKELPNLFPEEPPALLHGDLWSGNMMACADDKAAIYDPAIYYGNREMDIALTLLFGGFDNLFYHHYNNIYPLQNGWQQCIQLCQLYPLLVHLNLFGSSYYGRVKNVLRQYQ